MDAFSWLGDIVRAILQFVPRLTIVRPTHGGVRFRRGKVAREMRPGLHVYWPLITEIEVIPTARQTDNLTPQTLATKDRHTVAVSGFIVSSISDVVAAIGSTNFDHTSTIKDIAQAALVEVVTGLTLDELLSGTAGGVRSPLNKALTRACRRQLKRYGISVQRAGLVDCVPCRTYRLIGEPRT